MGDAAQVKVAQAARLVDGLAGDVVRAPRRRGPRTEPGGLGGAVPGPARAAPGHRRRRAGAGRPPLPRSRWWPPAPPWPPAAASTPGPAASGSPSPRRPPDEAPAPKPPGPPHAALAVDSPFDHPAQGFLYVARHLPEPNDPAFTAAMHEELHGSSIAAGGRTLALFTSRAAMERAADAPGGPGRLRGPRPGPPAPPRAAGPVPGRPRPRPSSPPRASGRASTCPGQLCHLVTIDRIPFPRPTDPLHPGPAGGGRAAGAPTPSPPSTSPRRPPSWPRGRAAHPHHHRPGRGRRLRPAPGHPGLPATLLATMPPLRRTVDRDQVLATLAELAGPADGPRPENDGNSAQRQGTGAISSK